MIEHIFLTVRFLLTSNGLLRHALGADPVHEYRPGLHKMCKHVKGDIGLMCTKLSETQVRLCTMITHNCLRWWMLLFYQFLFWTMIFAFLSGWFTGWGSKGD